MKVCVALSQTVKKNYQGADLSLFRKIEPANYLFGKMNEFSTLSVGVSSPFSHSIAVLNADGSNKKTFDMLRY